MIEKVTAYKASNGQTFEKLEDVQRYELEQLLLGEVKPTTKPGALASDPKFLDVQIDVASAVIVGLKDRVIDILTTGPRSKPKARSINGGTRKRAPKSPPAVDREGNPTLEKA